MSQIGRGLRRCASCLAALVLVFCFAMPVWPKDAPAAASVPALPQPLTKESIRELVARLSDDDVRKLLLDQLDRAATTTPAAAKAGMGMSGMVDEHAGAMRTTLGSLEAAYYALPDTLRQVATKLTEPDGMGQLLVIGELLVALLVAGFATEWLYHRALRRFRTRLEQTPATTYSARVFQFGMGLLIDLGGILVWSIAAITAFFLLWHDHELRRTTILDFMIGVIIVRTTMVLARFLLAPREPSIRLLPFADRPARTLYGFAVALATLDAILLALITLLRGGGADQATLDLVTIPMVSLGIAITLWTVWQVRKPIADLIRGQHGHGTIRSWLAELWPIVATAYFLGILFARVCDILAGERPRHIQRIDRRRAANRRHGPVPRARRGSGYRCRRRAGRPRPRPAGGLRKRIPARYPHRGHRRRACAVLPVLGS